MSIKEAKIDYLTYNGTTVALRATDLVTSKISLQIHNCNKELDKLDPTHLYSILLAGGLFPK